MDNESQLKLFDDDQVKPELGKGFQRINQAIAEGRIIPYSATIKGVPIWDPPVASEFKAKSRTDFVGGYGRKTNYRDVDEASLPDDLKPLQGMGYTFLQSLDSSCPEAIVFRKNGTKISGLDPNCDYAITPVAFLDYCGLIDDPFFRAEDKPEDSEGCYDDVDAKILKFAVEPIAAGMLGQKLRDQKGRFRQYYKARIEFLVKRGDLLSVPDGPRKTLYQSRRPDDPRPGSAPIEVAAEVVPDSTPLRQLAPAKSSKPTSALAVQESLIEKRFRQVFQNNPDMSCFLGIVTGALQAIGVPVLWVEFEERQWVTIRQAGELLGLDENTVNDHLLKSPFEMSILSDKLTGQRLNAYKRLYPFTPGEVNRSDRFTSPGVEVAGDWSASEFAPHFILVSPAGLAWLASKSETGPAKAIMQTDWIIKAELPGQIEKAMTHVADSAKTLAGQHATSTDLARFGLNEVMHGIGSISFKMTTPLDIHLLRNLRPSIQKVNEVLDCYNVQRLVGPSGDILWYQWDKRSVCASKNPGIYFITADLSGKGFIHELVSIGEFGINHKGVNSGRVSQSHQRIKALFNRVNGNWDRIEVFILELFHSRYEHEPTRKELERHLTSALQPFWENEMDRDDKQKWRSAIPDTGQQRLELA